MPENIQSRLDNIIDRLIWAKTILMRTSSAVFIQQTPKETVSGGGKPISLQAKVDDIDKYVQAIQVEVGRLYEELCTDAPVSENPQDR